MRLRPAALAIHAALSVLAGLTVLPLLWMTLASLWPSGATAEIPPPIIAHRWTLDHYADLLQRLNVGRYLWNSALLATATTMLSLAVNTLAGYGFAKLQFPGRARIMEGLLAAMVVPGQVAMLPLFFLLKHLGLVNTYAGAMIPGLASVFGIFLVRQYAQGIPDSLLDAARVDGASERRIFWSIALPVCRPILATLALFTFMGVWNDFMWPLIVLSDDRHYTLPVALANLSGEHAQDTELMLAGAVLTVLPVVLLFAAMQKHYIAGIAQGGVKQ